MISGGGNTAKQEELGKLVFKAKEDGIANFVIDGEFYSEKGQLIKTDFESLQVQIGKEQTNLEKQAEEEQGNNTQLGNAKLQSLRVDIEGMVPNFDTDVYEYDLTIPSDVNNIEVLAIAQNPNSHLEITGNSRIKAGTKFNTNKSYI